MRFLPVSPQLIVTALLLAASAQAQTPAPAAPIKPWGWDFTEFVDRLPEFLDQSLPGLKPEGALRLDVRPHFGDFIRRDYVRVPTRARLKVTEHIELSSELEGYFTHGLGDAASYGFSSIRFGSKYEQPLDFAPGAAFSAGVNYLAPLGRPPLELNDGYRHVLPFAAFTRPIWPKWHVIGYATVGADLLSRTDMQPHFGRNQLHTDTLGFSAGAAREWPRFHASVTATCVTSSLISNENRNVLSIRPEVVIPLTADKTGRVRVLLGASARAVHGPDGNEVGISSSLRIEFQNRRKAAGP